MYFTDIRYPVWFDTCTDITHYCIFVPSVCLDGFQGSCSRCIYMVLCQNLSLLNSWVCSSHESAELAF